MEIKNYFSKFKNNSVLFIIILIGVILMLFSGGDNKKESKPAAETYKADDETRLEKILSEINGISNVSVMITYYSGPESDIAYDTNTTTTKRGDGDKTSNTEERADRQAVMSSGEPFVKRFLYPEVKGAVIAAKGVDNAYVKQQIQDAVTTALGIAPHKVCVISKK